MIPPKHFYMIRHGQSEANALEQLAGRGWDTPLTDQGRAQARETHGIFDRLTIKPRTVVHSHLSRARDTARIINERLNLPMFENPDVAEHDVGAWERQPWSVTRPQLNARINPPGGESHDMFGQRVARGIAAALSGHDAPVLIVCHGGVFRGLGDVYGIRFHGIENCVLYEFTPETDKRLSFPWRVLRHHAAGSDALILDIASHTLRA